MVMGSEHMRQALEAASINAKKYQEDLRQENLAALQLVSIEENILSFFKEFSYNEEIEIGQFSYYQANCLKKNFTWEDDFKRAIESDLLLVGSGISGDIIAVDLLDFQTGILFHDYFWERPGENPRKFLIGMNCSLGQFYLNSVQIPDYPIDAYEAAAYMGAAFTGYEEDL